MRFWPFFERPVRQVRHCVDCAHFHRPSFGPPHCNRPVFVEDLVAGSGLRPLQDDAKIQRHIFPFAGGCGRRARFFTPKPANRKTSTPPSTGEPS